MSGLNASQPSRLARLLIAVAVGVLPRAHRDRFRAEWEAELEEYVRENVAVLPAAARILSNSFKMRRSLRHLGADVTRAVRNGLEVPNVSKIVFWRVLDKAEQGALRQVARSRQYRHRELLCHQGDLADHVIMIEDGWVKVASTTEDGHEVVLAVRGPGDLICESAVIGDRECSATVTALSDVRALVVPARRFTTFLDEYPRVWRLITRIFVQRIEEGDRRIQAHASANGAQRLALLLLELADLSQSYTPVTAEDGVVIRPSLSQEELGSWVDASRETVARTLKDWRRSGLVSTGWRQIVVLDQAGLHAYASPDARGEAGTDQQ